MLATGIWPLFLHSLLSFLLGRHPSLAFSLKNCTIVYPEDVNSVQVACSDHALTAIPDDIPRNATFLDLSSNNIVNIKRADLSGLSKLFSVLVHYNSISHIDDGAFADLAELRVLFMNMNELTNLTDNMFLGLSKLVSLYLEGNHISYISPKAFQSLVSIRRVILDTNQLHRITEIAPILKLPHIEELYLGYNKITSFDTDDLPLNVSNLRFLQLDMNPLEKFSITKDIFPHLNSLDLYKCSCDLDWDVPDKTFPGRLTSLDFGGTDISFEVYRTVLQDATLLQSLSLSTMKTWIDEGLIDVACQTPSLRTLKVSDSEIGIIGDTLLRSCSQLTELTLNGDDLTEMSERSLSSMTQLRSLDMHLNALSELPLAVRGLSTLETLDLSSNLISELDCLNFLNLTRLTKLNLERNCISSLRGCVFQPLNDLKVLNIQDNYVFVLDFRVNLQKLESLQLNNNGHLKLRQGDFGNLSALINLGLDSDTSYSLWEGVFEGLYNLQTLSLRITYCHKEHFRGLKHLENLTLHLTNDWSQKSPQNNDETPFANLHNLKKLVIKVYDKHHMFITPELLVGLTSLEHFMADRFFPNSLHQDTFKYTPRLKGLQISHSDLSCLSPELFWPIPNLQLLDLSSNKLRSLDFLASVKLPGLRFLKLSRNLLTIINETVVQSFPALIYLDLTDNPLTCECSNSGFNQWVQSSNQVQVVNGHQYACAFPLSQQGNKFLDFDIHSCWIDASFLCFISSSCLIVFTLLASFIYHFLRWHLAYAYYLFLAFVYDKKKRRKGAPYQYDAFVSYNVHDEAWVYREMLPVLEGDQGWRLCLHHRDFEPGKPIVENITEAIYGSRKTICVISQHYLQSEWCSREIQMASFRLFDEQEDVLILLFLEDVPAQQLSLYYRMRRLVKKRTYLSWSQAGCHTGVFWQNIRRALNAAEGPTEHTPLLTGHQ